MLDYCYDDGMLVRYHDDCSMKTMSMRVKAMEMMTYVHVDDDDYFGCLYYAFGYDDDDDGDDDCLSSIVDDH